RRTSGQPGPRPPRAGGCRVRTRGRRVRTTHSHAPDTDPAPDVPAPCLHRHSTFQSGSLMSTVMNPPAVHAQPDLAALKHKQQAAWASGDYAVVGTALQIVGETLCEAADVRTDERVLDIAAGNGNATLAAARRGARVVST